MPLQETRKRERARSHSIRLHFRSFASEFDEPKRVPDWIAHKSSAEEKSIAEERERETEKQQTYVVARARRRVINDKRATLSVDFVQVGRPLCSRLRSGLRLQLRPRSFTFAVCSLRGWALPQRVACFRFAESALGLGEGVRVAAVSNLIT